MNALLLEKARMNKTHEVVTFVAFLLDKKRMTLAPFVVVVMLLVALPVIEDLDRYVVMIVETFVGVLLLLVVDVVVVVV